MLDGESIRPADGPPTIEIEELDRRLDAPDDETELAETGSGRGRPVVGARRRRRQASIVVAAALLSAAAGVAVGSRLKSPAERAAGREAPPASRITVPVERRQLTASLTLAGEIQFDTPAPVRIAGPVGTSAGQSQVVTRAPAIGQQISEGGVIAEVSGRPVFAFQGELPVFRGFEPGSTGPDVAQLEAALARLGFDPGSVDEIYDDLTERAIDALYLAAGYQSEGPTDEQRSALREANNAVVSAEQSLATARTSLSEGGKTVSAAEKLAAQQEVSQATDAVPAAEQAAKRANDDAAAAVTTATGLRDAARTARDAAATITANASAPGAVNPETGVEFTSSEIAALQTIQAEKETALLNAESELTRTISTQAETTATGTKSVKEARDALALAQVRLADQNKPADTTSLSDAVDAAQAVLDQANADRFVLELESGTKFPAGEMVFLPLLPSTITSVNVAPGIAVPTTEIATVSSTDTRITARISRADAALVSSGLPVTITVRGVDLETTGTIASIGEPPSQSDPNTPEGSGSSGGSSGSSDAGRLQVVVIPDDPSVLADWVGSSVRIAVAVSATEGEVLAVPVAALFVGPDGSSQVEVERSPATADDPGTTEVIEVSVGLTAEGFAEIGPLGGASLVVGDRVLVGVEDSAASAQDDAESAAGSAASS